jgi:hypothetical protein
MTPTPRGWPPPYKLVGHVEKDWVAEAGKKGVNGAAVLAELRSIARNY